jgi:hypothetical protein
MQRLKRVLSTILAALSLVLFIAVVAVWIRTFFIRDIVGFVSGDGNGQIVQSIRGRLHIMTSLDGRSSGSFSHSQDRLVPNALWNGGMSSYPVNVEWHMGHVWQTYSRNHLIFSSPPAGASGFTTNPRLIVIPYWSPALLFAILPTIWIWQFVKHGQRRKIGHCPKCNYDLRATPQRCPECGWARAGL